MAKMTRALAISGLVVAATWGQFMTSSPTNMTRAPVTSATKWRTPHSYRRAPISSGVACRLMMRDGARVSRHEITRPRFSGAWMCYD